MLKMATTTKLSPEEAIKQTVKFFGSDGYGLEIKEQNPDYAYFVGGGGGIDVSACAKKNGASVELESREWDFQAKEFIPKIYWFPLTLSKTGCKTKE